MFREVRENREVERNLTYVNQESDVTNNENGSASDKEAISNENRIWKLNVMTRK